MFLCWLRLANTILMPAGARVLFAISRMALLESVARMEAESSIIISQLILVYLGTMSGAFLWALVLVGTLCQTLVAGVGRGPAVAAGKVFFLGGGGGVKALQGAGGGALGGGAGAADSRWERSFWTRALVAWSSNWRWWTSSVRFLS